MKLSPLQVARYQYNPKLPGMLRNGISEISVRNGGATQSVADQEKIAALFPNTYGKNEISSRRVSTPPRPVSSLSASSCLAARLPAATTLSPACMTP